MKSAITHINRSILIILIVVSCNSSVLSQTDMDTGKIETNESILNAIDSLSNLYFNQSGYKTIDEYQNRYHFELGEIPQYSDSVYYQRLQLIPSPIKLVYNQTVQQYIYLYTNKKRTQVEHMLGLSDYYFPMFEAALDKYNLPLELKYLPIIESAMNPLAVSRVGASGLWQFMYNTARMYGLKVNSYVDERRDPYLETDAAARFLKDLYDLYGDWSLVLAAYNSGPGNVNKAIRRSGGKTDYWEIRNYLPRETRGYVPAFIAATYVMSYAEEHNLRKVSNDLFFVQTDTVHINRNLALSRIADSIDMPLNDLIFLNPALKRKQIPYSTAAYALVLPADKISAFEEHKTGLYKNTVPASFADNTNETTNNISTNTTAASTSQHSYHYSSPNISNKTKLIYTVKSGDNLGYISEWYDCKVSDLKWWNNIRGTNIRVGQKLTVYVKKDQVDKYKRVDNLSFEQKQSAESSSSYSGSSTATSQSSGPVKYMYYTIKPGDTLWDIANKYSKNTVEDLKRINNITDLKSVKPGVVIKIII